MNQTQDEGLIFNVLSYMKKTEEPVGAGSVQRYLESCGFSMAEATVGRLLRDMDCSGLIVRKSNQGRILTKAGETRLRELESVKWQGKWTENFIGAVKDAHLHFDRLRELMIARRPVEIEVARLAAKNATEEEIGKLRKLVEQQEKLAKEGKQVSNIDTEFHTLLAKISRNKILEAIVELLRKQEEDAREFEGMRRKAGNIFNHEHRRIFEAIEQHDPDMAVLAMKRHLGNVLHNLQKQ